MLKTIFKILFGSAIGILATLYAINWQEESLVYSLSDPAKFGEITYQNLKIKNEGWNPAENIKIYLGLEYINKENIQSSPPFNYIVDEEGVIGGFDRLRRSEVVTVAFSYRGASIKPSELTIKSDRSIAKLEIESDDSISLVTILALTWLGVLLVSIVAAIATPQYREYIRRAKQVAESRE